MRPYSNHPLCLKDIRSVTHKPFKFTPLLLSSHEIMPLIHNPITGPNGSNQEPPFQVVRTRFHHILAYTHTRTHKKHTHYMAVNVSARALS